MSEIKLTIDGTEVTATKGQTILQAALGAGIYIPHLCYHPILDHVGECKLCVVELAGEQGVWTSCSVYAEDGMAVTTKSNRLLHLRQLSMELMLANHPSECTACPKYLKCELQALTQYLGVNDSRLHKLQGNDYMTEENPLMIRDLTRCVLCGRCVRACKGLRGADVLDFHRQGDRTWIAPKKGAGLLKDGDCHFCGACIAVCPTGAIRDKDEVFAGFNTQEQALVPCRSSCPAGTDVPRYLALIRQGDYPAALAVVREKAPFPLSLGHVCVRFCEDKCRRKDVNEAVGIRQLKKFAAEHGGEGWKAHTENAPATGKRVAVMGAGVAGLTAAYYLARKGHSVDVFEKLSIAGGMLRVGIPAYRLPAEVVQREIDNILESGIKLHLSTQADSPEKLIASGYNCVVAAIGTHKGRRLPIAGNSLDGVLTATDFLRSVALGENIRVGKRVVVLGGGNVAFDCARTAKRLGAEQIVVACLEPRDKMAASKEEVLDGLAEGIEIYNSCTFERIEQSDCLNVICAKVKKFSFESGKLILEKEPGSEHCITADIVIFAAGQLPEIPEGYGFELSQQGLIMAQTGVEGVFACGDCVSGTASVVEAIAAARDTAQKVDFYLGGNGDITETLAKATERSPCLGQTVENFAELARVEEKRLPLAQCGGFACTAVPSSECDAHNEANRCLQCDLRIQIPKVKFWSEYAVR